MLNFVLRESCGVFGNFVWDLVLGFLRFRVLGFIVVFVVCFLGLVGVYDCLLGVEEDVEF